MERLGCWILLQPSHNKKTAAAAAAEQEALMSFELTMTPVEGVVFENTDEARCMLLTAFG